MFKRKIRSSNLFGAMYRKMFFKEIPKSTKRTTIHLLKLIIMFIFLFIIFGILILLFTGGNSYLQIIIGYSITGFFTFFMGYFGWILAQALIDAITGGDKRIENGVSYYFRKLRRKK